MHTLNNISILFFKDKANLCNMYKIKLHKTSKSMWPVHIHRYVCCEMNVFFNVFINHFPKISRSIFRKITIDLLYFWDVYDVNLWENVFGRSTAYSCRTNAFI